MVGPQYQAEVPYGLCHYKDGEKGDCCSSVFNHVHNVSLHTKRRHDMNTVTNLAVMYFDTQFMRMKTSYCGGQVYWQKTRLGLSCQTFCHGRQMKRWDVTNHGCMFEIVSRSVMSFIYQSFHVVTQ